MIKSRLIYRLIIIVCFSYAQYQGWDIFENSASPKKPSTQGARTAHK